MTTDSRAASIGTLLARIATAGVLVLAGFTKLRGGPAAFALSIESFQIVPPGLLLPVAYVLPWLEIVVAAALLAGVWTREAAVLAVGMLAVFTVGLASVLARDLKIDCGCFGGLFGESTVTWGSVARNGVFIAIAAVPLWLGGGRIALTRDDAPPRE